MGLYELSGQYLALEQMLEADPEGMSPEELAEFEQGVKDTLESLDGEIEETADGLACVYKNLLAKAESIKAEAKTLTARAAAKQTKADSLLDYLQGQMLLLGKRKIETTRNVLSIRSTASVKVEDEQAFMTWAFLGNDGFVRRKPPEVDKAAVKKALKEGLEIPGVTLEQGESLSIK